ncbi:hypothetical protein SNE40_009019 [Patella caerulea]|uniref:Integrase p58-like C-terminal domain-containing protein n=1 Tax=Patella caerulea TaxID=87958 RepID=A0AAN8JR54_PATCE
MIRAYLKDQSDCDLHLGCLAAVYRSTPQESTGLTPNLLMMGKEVRLPVEIVFGSSNTSRETVSNYGSYVEILKERMQKADELCLKYLNAVSKRQKDRYDSKKSIHSYTADDLIWYLHPIRKNIASPTLVMPYDGPYKIIKKLNEQNYLIQIKGQRKVVHHDKLMPYLGVAFSKKK